eukprot:CAMPEP_0171845390 /NCGR_PEP_ID=MMETSP0992-20121227/17078_1 /TAXON_ID=483369 /ORGANISM="non described non described, Strain CCMP2098" /LENGTH=186 /DNA_ID=CAMNT_0012463451 /DNA_START=212 /DNA_END=772 /DNA_ORIENTATION=+
MWMTSYFNDRAPTNSASAAAKENDSVPQTSWLLKTLEFLLGGDALGFAHHHPEDALGAMLNTPAEIHENVGPNQSFRNAAFAIGGSSDATEVYPLATLHAHIHTHLVRNAAFAIGGSSDATEVYPLATLSAPAKKALKMKQHFDADFQRGLLRNAAGAHTLFDKDQSPNPLRAVHWPNYKPKKSKK